MDLGYSIDSKKTSVFLCSAECSPQRAKLANGARLAEEIFLQGELLFSVILFSLEHFATLVKRTCNSWRLGKEVDVIAREHPTDILPAHPMLEEAPGQVELGEAVDELQSLQFVVEGVYRDVLVFQYVCDASQ